VLPALPGTRSSTGIAINDRGVAVGNYAASIGETRALLWPRASTRVPRTQGGVE
jgi:hypothetical protein